MQLAVNTSPYYSAWIKKVNKDLEQIKSAIISHDIQKTGEIAEQNALAMHATTHYFLAPYSLLDFPNSFYDEKSMDAESEI